MASVTDQDDPAPIEAAADRAAAQGDVPAARRLLRQLVAQSPGRLDAWLKLAAMHRAAGDTDAALGAVSGALRVAPLHFMALLSRARLLEGVGRMAEAAQAYDQALAQLPPDQPVPAHLEAAVAHGAALGAAHRATLATRLTDAAGADPALGDRERRRLHRFTTNALRDTRVYHSEPTHYHYPGLVEREFHDREEFPWLATLEAATDAIREEFTALLDERRAVAEPYVQYAADAPVRQWAALNHSMDWTAFHLLKNGDVVAGNAARCPRTMAVLAQIPQPRIANRSPNAMFSLLKPRTSIPPHTGVANTRLVCHLPLVIPAGCWFRVGAERREWRLGEAFVFDDTIEHEAANDSDLPRAVLIIDAWHPGLSTTERAAIARVMEVDETTDDAGL